MKIISLQTGGPQTYPGKNGKPVTTSIYRKSILTPVTLFHDHLENDQPTNTRVHGGPDKAVNVYPGEHYAYWQATSGGPLPPNGSFGENFTTDGWLEETACIGDVCRVGEALVQISQPRRPCDTLAWRWGIPGFIHMVNKAGRTGWYLRVLEEGIVQAGNEIVLHERPFPDWTIARANSIILDPRSDRSASRALADCPALAHAWVEMLEKALG